MILTPSCTDEEPLLNVAGIDVSSKTITLAISRDGQIGNAREFKNTPHGPEPKPRISSMPLNLPPLHRTS